jgi:hypothetical protein
LLQRDGQIGVLRPELPEQSRVLDGDRGLVGEGLHEGYLAVGERPDLMPVDDDRPQQLASSEHRDRQDGPDRVHGHRPIAVLGVGQDVMDLHGAPLERGAAGGARARRSQGVALEKRG